LDPWENLVVVAVAVAADTLFPYLRDRSKRAALSAVAELRPRCPRNYPTCEIGQNGVGGIVVAADTIFP
jgi:hypothetical protein